MCSGHHVTPKLLYLSKPAAALYIIHFVLLSHEVTQASSSSSSSASSSSPRSATKRNLDVSATSLLLQCLPDSPKRCKPSCSRPSAHRLSSALPWPQISFWPSPPNPPIPIPSHPIPSLRINLSKAPPSHVLVHTHLLVQSFLLTKSLDGGPHALYSITFGTLAMRF
ncbi:hypothetical protein GGI42DRAFT_61928 [Trichoderma sp. SZMC 28013]